MTEIDVLRTWARRHGGDIVRVAPKDFAHVKQLPSFSDAPFSSNDIGVHWRSARVVYAGATLWTEFVHELGHCFASRVGIDDQFEFDFLGWEVALVRELGLDYDAWRHENRYYAVTKQGKEFGDLNRNQQDQLVEERIRHGQAIGIVDQEGRVLSVRHDVRPVPATLRRFLDKRKRLRTVTT